MSAISDTQHRPLSSDQAGWLPRPPIEPLFELATGEAQQSLNLPPRHARLTLLAAAASVYQGHHNVRLPDGRVTPLSLTVALQGAPGPTTAFYDGLLHKTRRVMSEQMAQHSARLMTCADEWTRWQQQYQRLLSRDDYRGIAVLMECQPDTPRLFQTHYEQMPWKEVYHGLQRNVPSAAWLIPEHPGELTLERLLGDTTFTALANGDTPACLTTLMLCDREEHRRIRLSGEKRQTNPPGAPHVLLAETLEDYVTENAPNGGAAMPATEALEARLAKQYRHNLILAFAPEMTKATLEFSPTAKIYWRTQLRAQAANQGRQALMAQVDDTITPWGKTVARVAALLHLIEGVEGDISLETLHSANLICCPRLSDDVSPVLATTATTPHDGPQRSATVQPGPQACRRGLPIRRPKEGQVPPGARGLANVG